MSGFFSAASGSNGGKSVAEFDEAELARAPHNQILAQADRCSDHGDAKRIRTRIAVAHGIETVLADASEAELARDQLAIENNCRSASGRSRAGEHRPASNNRPSDPRPLESFELGEQIMREEDAGSLQMG